jgi:galactose-1-phosphate uridylyltransferase
MSFQDSFYIEMMGENKNWKIKTNYKTKEITIDFEKKSIEQKHAYQKWNKNLTPPCLPPDCRLCLCVLR